MGTGALWNSNNCFGECVSKVQGEKLGREYFINEIKKPLIWLGLFQSYIGIGLISVHPILPYMNR